jgi:chemotaxis protein MotB
MRLHQRIRREQGKHTDDWLITYADTITLLLCLFVIILSIKTADKNLARDVTAQTNHAPPLEDIFGEHPPFHALIRVADPATGESPPQNTSDAAELALENPWRMNTAAAETPPETIGDAAEPDSVPTRHIGTLAGADAPLLLAARPTPPIAPNREIAPASLPAVVDRLKSHGTVVVEQQGDRITTLQISSGAFFGSGYAALSGAGKSILRDVAITLRSGEFAAYHISIEGHTDDMPISTTQFQSNWELSTARAAAVVRFFLEEGIPARRLTAAGYADTFPIVPNRNVDGTVIPDNQARNRRVVIRLEKIDKAKP